MLPQVGGAAFRRFGFVQSSVVSRWREIVGERYAAVSSPESIRFPAGRRQDGVLHLIVEGAYAPMMQHVEPAIVERVNRFFGYPAVARLRLTQGRPVVPPAASAPRAPCRAPANMEGSLRDVADPELREVLSALAGAIAARDEANAPSPRPAAVPMLGIPILGRLSENQE